MSPRAVASTQSAELDNHVSSADGTTSRMVNPVAWDKGLVFVQCGQCKAWHKIQDAAGLIDEIRYADEDEESSLSSDAEGS